MERQSSKAIELTSKEQSISTTYASKLEHAIGKELLISQAIQSYRNAVSSKYILGVTGHTGKNEEQVVHS